MLLVTKTEKWFCVSLQPAVIDNISISSLWWHRENSPFSRVKDVTQQQLGSFAVRAAGLAASVSGSAALLLEVEFLTSHLSEGTLAQQLAAGLPDWRTCWLTWWCITEANVMATPWPFTSTMMTYFLFPLSLSLTVRHGCRKGREEGGWGETGKGKVWRHHVIIFSTTDTPLAFFSVFPFQEYGVPFMETSAKTGVNVELAFLAIAK